jgi:hypothetical protein
MQWIKNLHALSIYMYIIYVLTHVYLYIQDWLIMLVLNWQSIEWQIKSMNFEINMFLSLDL